MGQERVTARRRCTEDPCRTPRPTSAVPQVCPGEAGPARPGPTETQSPRPPACTGRRDPPAAVSAAVHTDFMSSRRRHCPECRREIAVVAGRFARHDPPGARENGELTSCPGSRRTVPSDAAQPTLDGYVVPPFPGQLPLF
ncbi:hypothetical protein GCM10010512_35250 [Streptomyces thermoviolaceus subsp. thermoviolaceus]|nr:hypothetical protein GCM10010512_35250 [Streptomyces thermoviolaceus subsp. thermoviolaceus]